MLTIQDQIDWLQRFIILHSYIYYELDGNAISDKVYDEKSKKLVEYKNTYPELWKSSEYYDQFGDDYDGSTGFTLFHNLDSHQQSIIKSLVKRNMVK